MDQLSEKIQDKIEKKENNQKEETFKEQETEHNKKEKEHKQEKNPLPSKVNNILN